MPNPYFSKDSLLESLLLKNKAVEIESTYRTAPIQVLENQLHWICKIVHSADVITLYKYNLTHAPGESVDQVSIGSLSSVNWSNNYKIHVNIDKDTTGLYTAMPGASNSYLIAARWDTNENKWRSLKNVTKIAKTDTITDFNDSIAGGALPIETDGCENRVLDDIPLFPNGKIAILFYCDSKIITDLDIPFGIAITGKKEA